jgi:hypothetical protein
MNSTGPQRRCQATVPEYGLLDGIVIGEHSHDHFAVADRTGRRVGHTRALRSQRLGLAACPVINGYRVSGPK